VERARADYERWMRAGRDALAGGDGTRAREAFAKATAIWKHDEVTAAQRDARVRELRTQAASAADARDWAGAMESIRQAGALVGGDPDVQVELERYRRGQADEEADLAHGALARGDLDEAVTRADAALAVVTDHPRALAVRHESAERRALPVGFVYVRAGDYPIGAAEQPHNPRQTVSLPSYYMAVHEVTNLEYAAFVVAGGYTEDRYWDADALPLREQFTDETGQPGPKRWQAGAYTPGAENEPVTGTCWYEARAYARWAGGRLPTEAELEVAASYDPAAGEAREYPWGDEWDRARVGLHLDPSLADVGSRRGDLSALGVRDCAGNALEWTDGRWSRDGPHRVIRGGGTHRLAVSAANPEQACRVANRQMRADPAAARLAVVGFRIVKVPPRGEGK
jgi:formylglycine-generating enzyme required for sulfatase activity